MFITILQIILYFFGPFFCYPWKPFLNTFYGSNYTIGYKHFWLQHQDPFNLLWHLICLVYQVIGNFSLLLLIDQYLFNDQRWLSKATALIWILYLGSVKICPPYARFCSVISIAITYQIVPYIQLLQAEFYVIISFFLVWILQAISYGPYLGGDAPAIIGLLILKSFLPFLLQNYIGIYSNSIQLISIVYIVSLLLLSSRLDAVKTLIASASLIGHIISIITNEKIFYYHSIAYTAMLFQGLAHELSKEAGTLVKLMDETNHQAKVSYEWSHVTYFPNLLFHAVIDSYKINKNKIFKAK